MTVQDAYTVMYKILDDDYHKTKNDSLGSLLSDMDTGIFSDRKAADPATYNDWYNIVSKYVSDGEISDENMIVALKEFLIYYQKEFGYDLEDVIKYISEVES